MKTGAPIARVPRNEETATPSGPSPKRETFENPGRKERATKSKTARLEEPTSASSAAPAKRSPPPAVVGLRDPVEPRLSRREKRRADRAGLGVFRFGPPGF